MAQQLRLPEEKLDELLTITQTLTTYPVASREHQHELSVLNDHAHVLYARLMNIRFHNCAAVDDEVIHYLRSPLNIVSAYAELLLEDDVAFRDDLRQICRIVSDISAYLETLGS